MENKSIEQCFAELGEILRKLEAEGIGLEESFRLYKEGLGLVNTARDSINKVEEDLKVLSEQNGME